MKGGGAQQHVKKPLCCLRWLARSHTMGQQQSREPNLNLPSNPVPFLLHLLSSQLPASPNSPALHEFAWQGAEALQHVSSWTNPKRHTHTIPPLLVLCLGAIPLLWRKGQSREKAKWGKIQRDNLPSLWGAFSECMSTAKWSKQNHFCCYHSSLGPLKKRNNSSQKRWIFTLAVYISLCSFFGFCYSCWHASYSYWKEERLLIFRHQLFQPLKDFSLFLAVNWQRVCL